MKGVTKKNHYGFIALLFAISWVILRVLGWLFEYVVGMWNEFPHLPALGTIVTKFIFAVIVPLGLCAVAIVYFYKQLKVGKSKLGWIALIIALIGIVFIMGNFLDTTVYELESIGVKTGNLDHYFLTGECPQCPVDEGLCCGELEHCSGYCTQLCMTNSDLYGHPGRMKSYVANEELFNEKGKLECICECGP